MTTANLHLHVRELPGGRFVVTPVPFCYLSTDAATYEQARAAAVSAVADQLSGLEGSQRSVLTPPWRSVHERKPPPQESFPEGRLRRAVDQIGRSVQTHSP